MVKNHLKRIATPRTWNIHRKQHVFVTRPNPGAHTLTHALSLNTIIKEMLGLADTTKEVKRILKQKEVLVDGKRRHDNHHNVGFLDVITFTDTKAHYRLGFTEKGQLAAFTVPEKEATLKVARIDAKKTTKGGACQLCLNDGKTILLKKNDYHVGDSLLITLPQQGIEQHLPLAEGASIIVYQGKHAGTHGIVEKIEGQSAIIKTTTGTIHTKKSYAFVVGNKQPVITCAP